MASSEGRHLESVATKAAIDSLMVDDGLTGKYAALDLADDDLPPSGFALNRVAVMAACIPDTKAALLDSV